MDILDPQWLKLDIRPFRIVPKGKKESTNGSQPLHVDTTFQSHDRMDKES